MIQTVGTTDRDESLPAADSAGAGKGGEGKLCLRKRQLSLVA
jgi:hypothetical protein